MITDWPQVVATTLAGAAAVAAVVRAAIRDRHPLALVERLTAIAADVRSATVRQLIEDERDERAIRWVSERRAPSENRLRRAGGILFWIGVAALLVWVVGVFIDRTAVWAWVAYCVGLVSAVASRAVVESRMKRRGAWINQERQWRQLPEWTAAERVDTPQP
jgi:hypothetical protein